MTIPAPALLRSMAFANALLVMPALGESYEGKTAATMAGLLLCLAADAEPALERRLAATAELEALFADAAERMGDPALAAPLPPGGVAARFDAALARLARLHAWADDHDGGMARACRAFLARFTAADRLAPPAMPGG